MDNLDSFRCFRTCIANRSGIILVNSVVFPTDYWRCLLFAKILTYSDSGLVLAALEGGGIKIERSRISAQWKVFNKSILLLVVSNYFPIYFDGTDQLRRFLHFRRNGDDDVLVAPAAQLHPRRALRWKPRHNRGGKNTRPDSAKELHGVCKEFDTFSLCRYTSFECMLMFRYVHTFTHTHIDIYTTPSMMLSLMRHLPRAGRPHSGDRGTDANMLDER